MRNEMELKRYFPLLPPVFTHPTKHLFSVSLIQLNFIYLYTLKNTRPQGLFSKSPPDEYNYAEQVNCIQDPYIRHMLKCVNRGPWPTLDLMDDPYSYVIDFRKNLLAGNSTATQCFDFATQQFKHWQNSLLP